MTYRLRFPSNGASLVQKTEERKTEIGLLNCGRGCLIQLTHTRFRMGEN